jgi:hypothetical protein
MNLLVLILKKKGRVNKMRRYKQKATNLQIYIPFHIYKELTLSSLY